MFLKDVPTLTRQLRSNYFDVKTQPVVGLTNLKRRKKDIIALCSY